MPGEDPLLAAVILMESRSGVVQDPQKLSICGLQLPFASVSQCRLAVGRSEAGGVRVEVAL